ncbi:head GIN domain-containing protein [Flavobacterium rivuli]|uniref:head GIN domain-containing protein n=1 Tax=Flavobacterium rivuli TaxID=498301 RepID=UPI00037E92D0|nr:head GIN domain-containing protein [Flavobacterium rivuli]
MKQKLQFIACLLLLVLTSCNNDLTPECFEKMGAVVTYDAKVPDFSAINLSLGIELVITEGPVQKVSIQTGNNIKQYISAEVKEGKLYLTNAVSCNWVRDYKSTTVYVTTPHLEQIYSASQFAVKSNGVLTFPSLSLQSGIFSETASGTFELDVNCQNLSVDDNQACYYVINGVVENLAVSFYSGDARFDGSNLIAQKLRVFHRSTNDIIANVQQEVTGTLYGTGNLVLKNHPPVVTVNRIYTGQVVYE